MGDVIPFPRQYKGPVVLSIYEMIYNSRMCGKCLNVCHSDLALCPSCGHEFWVAPPSIEPDFPTETIVSFEPPLPDPA
jgi:hypothetical protein